tara:strand:+ start:1064 stop:1750 length:687 start_codon:yes stop_codon:yes gene_type:complete
MADRAEANDLGILAISNKQGQPDSISPTYDAAARKAILDRTPMQDEVVSKSDLIKLFNTRAAMGNTVKTDGIISKPMTGVGSPTLTPPDNPQPLTGGDYAGYVPITEFAIISEGGDLYVVDSQILVGADGDYGSSHAWVDSSSSLNNNQLSYIFCIERSGQLIFSERPTGTRAFNGADRTNIGGGGFLDGLVAGDKISVWVAVESSATIEIYDANLGLEMKCPANLVV